MLHHETEIPFTPGRVVLQDFTGVPAMVDLAAMRSAMVRMNGDPAKVNPQVQCDLVIGVFGPAMAGDPYAYVEVGIVP